MDHSQGTTTMRLLRLLSVFFFLILVPSFSQEQSSFACKNDDDCVNGVCILMPEGLHYCQCTPGFGGQDCGSECDLRCQNGGSCRFRETTARPTSPTYCECPPHQAEGSFCELPFMICPGRQAIRCFHGGTCNRTTEGYECVCPEGRTGEFCQVVDYSQVTSSPTIITTTTNQSTTDYDPATKTAVILLVSVILGAAFLTVIATTIFGRKAPLLDTSTTDAVHLEREDFES